MSNIVKVEDIEKVKSLFGDWENNFLISCLQGIMGEMYSLDLDNPKSQILLLQNFLSRSIYPRQTVSYLQM